MSSETMALVIVDHGSRVEQSNRQLDELAELVRQRRPGVRVYPAHMSMAQPTLAEAVARAAADGATRIVVHPYFLAAGGHIQKDIPQQIAQATAAAPGVRVEVTAPLGLDEKLAELVWQRVDETLGQGPQR